MDYLALMACHAAGVIALIFAAKDPTAGLLTHLYAVAAGLYMSFGFVALGLQTHALSPAQWTGEAQTGPLTLLVIVISVALPFVLGWEREIERRR